MQANMYVATRRTLRLATKGEGLKATCAGATPGAAILHVRECGVPSAPGASRPLRAGSAGRPCGASLDPPLAPGDAASIAKAPIGPRSAPYRADAATPPTARPRTRTVQVS